jgi:transposase
MQLHTLARRLPDEVWVLFEPILPPVVWGGEGRPPASNRVVLHGLRYVLITGIGWDYVPPCFPCGKTLQGRLRRWLEFDAFRTAWQQMARRYEQLHGINGDKVLVDGSKKPSKKGARTPARAPSIGPSAARPAP